MNAKTVTQLTSAVCLAVISASCAPSASEPAQTPAPAIVRVDTVLIVDTVASAPMAVGEDLEAGRFDNGKIVPRRSYLRLAWFSPTTTALVRASRR
jgi:hypothetical protein